MAVHASLGTQLNAQTWHFLAQWAGIASETKTHVVLVLNLPLRTVGTSIMEQSNQLKVAMAIVLML